MPQRIHNDQYLTNADDRGQRILNAAFSKIVLRPDLSDLILDPCSGEMAFKEAMHEWFPGNLCRFVSVDIDRSLTGEFEPDCYADMTISLNWAIATSEQGKSPDWVVMNPSFHFIHEFFDCASRHASKGLIMLANINWMEPVEKRLLIHQCYQPTQIITLPRHSYTGDGKKYSLTSALYVYDFRDPRPTGRQSIDFVLPGRDI